MSKATVTSKGQVTIPKDIRDALNLHVGTQLNFTLTQHGEVIVSSATESISKLKGFIKHNRKKPVSQAEMKKAIKLKSSRGIK